MSEPKQKCACGCGRDVVPWATFLTLGCMGVWQKDNPDKDPKAFHDERQAKRKQA